MASAQQVPPIQEQQQFWDWHWQNLEERKVLNDWTERRAREIFRLIQGLHLERPRILDMGCGQGWFTERLSDLATSPELTFRLRPLLRRERAARTSNTLPQTFMRLVCLRITTTSLSRKK